MCQMPGCAFPLLNQSSQTGHAKGYPGALNNNLYLHRFKYLLDSRWPYIGGSKPYRLGSTYITSENPFSLASSMLTTPMKYRSNILVCERCTNSLTGTPRVEIYGYTHQLTATVCTRTMSITCSIRSSSRRMNSNK